MWIGVVFSYVRAVGELANFSLKNDFYNVIVSFQTYYDVYPHHRILYFVDGYSWFLHDYFLYQRSQVYVLRGRKLVGNLEFPLHLKNILMHSFLWLGLNLMSQFNLENVTAFDYKGSSSKVSKPHLKHLKHRQGVSV